MSAQNPLAPTIDLQADHKVNSFTIKHTHTTNMTNRKRIPGKVKRVRTIFTAEQLKRLEQEFANQMYLVGDDRIHLANDLRLSESQVKVWFQNRRIKHRKLNSARPPSGSGGSRSNTPDEGGLISVIDEPNKHRFGQGLSPESPQSSQSQFHQKPHHQQLQQHQQQHPQHHQQQRQPQPQPQPQPQQQQQQQQQQQPQQLLHHHHHHQHHNTYNRPQQHLHPHMHNSPHPMNAGPVHLPPWIYSFGHLQ